MQPSDIPLATTLAPPESVPLRPMTLGEILDRALQMFRSNFGRLMTLMLVFQAPVYGFTKAFQYFLRDKAPVLSRPGAFEGVVASPEQFGWFFLGASVTMAVTLLITQLAIAAMASGASRAFLGERIDPASALKDTFSRTGDVLGTFVLLMLWSGLVLAISALPGIALVIAVPFADSRETRTALAISGLLLMFAAIVIAALWLVLRYALVSEVVIIERLSFRKALARSAKLMAGRIGPSILHGCKMRASVVYAVNLVLSITVGTVSAIPFMLVNQAFGTSPLNPEKYDPALVPVWAIVPVELFQLLAQSALAPYGMLAIIVFYFDLRIRKEGFDLELLASRMEAR